MSHPYRCIPLFLALLLPVPARAAEKPVLAPVSGGGWDAVWQAAQSPLTTLPSKAKQQGPPLRDGDYVLFRFRAPTDATKVFLAGSFNKFAHNQNGEITNNRFAMIPVGDNFYFKRVRLERTPQKYKFVVLDKNGKFRWVSDPQVKESDKDGNTVVNFGALQNLEANNSHLGTWRTLKPFVPLIMPVVAEGKLDVRAEKVWVRPDQPNALLITLGDEVVGGLLNIKILTPFGTSVYQMSVPAQKGENRVIIPPLETEGGFLAQAVLSKGGAGQTPALAQGETVLSCVQSIADDLRYGFYATYRHTNGDYSTKAALLAKMHINAVEFYDYFPTHGYYAPREENYKFEPFGIPLNARDVQNKIKAGHERGILSIAYVAAYAAGESIYRQYPYPMTEANGIPKVFNGQVMSEVEAEKQNKPKWFWLMDVSKGSPWHNYILDEFGRTLDDSPNDLVSFDGFELDTYGDRANSKFYAKGSRRNGDLLTDVLHDFVGDVQARTRQIKPGGLVSFNSVNEFGVEKMSDVTDFGFLEIWNSYASNLEDLVDICFYHRAPLSSQRVVFKLYPADMNPRQKTWPVATLRRALGATMTGAASLMVAGEPNEKSGQMHGLNSLFYPDHQALLPEAERVLQEYYAFDALMYGTTHGRDVKNTTLDMAIPGCITRTYAAPAKKALVVQMLNVANEQKWSAVTPESAARKNLEVVFDLPGGIAPRSLLFASPDAPALQKPVNLDFEVQNGRLRALLPELQSYGALVFRY
jgi:hypothetical protein